VNDRERFESGTIFTAKRLLPRPEQWVAGGGLLVIKGRIAKVLESSSAVRRAGCPVVDLGDAMITPSTVCAHAHLELSALQGRTTVGSEMLPWIREVMGLRGELEPGAADEAALLAAQELLESGTTFVGDIDSSGGDGLPSVKPAPARIAFREFLDGGDANRREAALAELHQPLEQRVGQREGLSPHAPHTVSAPLLKAIAQSARSRNLPVQMHWSETRAEVDWLKDGSGPFGELLKHSPRSRGFDLMESAGLFDTTLSLVHGNYPEEGEAERLATKGVSVVHCPGSHAFFERVSFPIETYRSAGVSLALGTDSLASNQSLDMRREMKLLSASAPSLAPEEIWAMATLHGAKALGVAGEFGELSPGCRADFVVFLNPESTRAEALEWLTRSLPQVKSVYCGGALAFEATP
jgi:cytosine/adenosine deaminase-related metal-dependent hydrolase